MTELTYERFFELAFKYPTPSLLQDKGPILELGPGDTPIFSGEASVKLDLPEWDSDIDPIPYPDNHFGTVYAIYILEHVSDWRKFLREIDRVLKPGGHANIAVPHGMVEVAIEDPDHKSFWSEESWKAIFANEYYQKNTKGWNLKLHCTFLMARKYRNLTMFAQLVKV